MMYNIRPERPRGQIQQKMSILEKLNKWLLLSKQQISRPGYHEHDGFQGHPVRVVDHQKWFSSSKETMTQAQQTRRIHFQHTHPQSGQAHKHLVSTANPGHHHDNFSDAWRGEIQREKKEPYQRTKEEFRELVDNISYSSDLWKDITKWGNEQAKLIDDGKRVQSPNLRIIDAYYDEVLIPKAIAEGKLKKNCDRSNNV